MEMTAKCIHENARNAQNQDISSATRDLWQGTMPPRLGLRDDGRHRPAVSKERETGGLHKTLGTQKEPVAEFDERLWSCMMDYVTVGIDGDMAVVLRD
ncbi:MAG: hypothetical protein ACTTH3_07870 [Schwartzia sp. (in: firmicutes)]